MALALQTVQDATTQQNFEAIALRFPLGSENVRTGTFLQLLTTGTARKLAIGSDSVTGDGTASKTDATAHGLGTTPIFAIAIVQDTGGITNALCVTNVALDSTNATFSFVHINATNWSSTVPYLWLAVG